ncbi:MAG: TonB-dependent receptor, partial [Saprospiraceae bacterium]
MDSRILYSTIFIFLSLTAWSQTGSVKGKVIDAKTGESLPGATVVIKDTDYNTATNEQGDYSIPHLAEGKYELAIHLLGYANDVIAIEILSGGNQPIIHKLNPGAVELQSISITAQPELQSKIISAVDIHLRSTNTSQDVLRMVPGLFIAQHAGGGKAEQIFLRGFDIDHGTDIAVTTDGIPVNMVSHAHGQGYADLHYLIPETVERVHFGKGPYHTHKGNMATAGYVGFQTMNSLDESTVSFQVGQFNSYRTLGMINLLDHQQDDKSQNAYIAGEYYTSDGYFESPQAFNRTSLFGKFNRTIGTNHFLTISVSTFASRWDASGQIPQRAVESGLINFFGAIDDTEGGATARSNANVQLHSNLSSDSWLKNQVYYSNYDFELYSNFTFFLNDPVNGDQIKQKERRDMFGYNGSYNRTDQLGGIETTSEIGLQIRNDNSIDNELSHTADKDRIIERLAFGDIRETNIGVFVNETFRISSMLTINTGIRYDHFDFAYENHLLSNEKLRSTEGIISPKINVYLKLNDRLQLSYNTGYGFHSNDTRVVVYAKDLKTLPRALGMDVGTIWKANPKLILSASLWRLQLDQEFVYVGDEAVVEPSGKTNRMGVEVSGRWQILDWLYADADFNYTIARSTDEPVDLSYIPLAPRFSSIGGITVMTNQKWNGSLRYRMLGDRPANEENSVIASGYTVFDALVSYRFKNIEVGLNAENV